MKKKRTPRTSRRPSPRSLLAPAALLCACADPAAPTTAAQPTPATAPAPAAQVSTAAQGRQAAPVADTFVSHSTRAFGAPSFTWVGADLRLPAGAGPVDAARQTLRQLARAQGIRDAVLDTTQLRALHDVGRGPLVAQFEQRVDQIEVFQAGLNIALSRDLKPVAATGTLAKALRPKSRDFGGVANAAIATAVSTMTGAAASAAQVSLTAPVDPAGYGRYAVASAGAPTARAKRVWYPQPGGLVPAHYVEVEVGAQEGTDSRLESFVVSAAGEVLFRKDLVAAESYKYRVWADKDGRYVPFDSPQGNDYTPHPKGAIDGTVPSMKPSNLVTLQNAPFSKNDPWLPPGAMELKGNNTFAYADIKAPDGYAAGDVTVTPTAPGAFDRTYDPNTQPAGSTEAIQAITTNLFYVINFMHDYFYDAGWDEKSLNPQSDNFGRGGTGNDPIKAEAQDYSGRNNANASTPADGSSPRIQMFLWDTSLGRKLTITAPMDIAGEVEVASAGFGPKTFDATQTVVAVDDGVVGMGMTPGTKSDGCETPFANAADVAGKAVLIERGFCPFVQKVQNAQDAGARAVIIMNNAAGLPPNPMGGTSATINIPVLGISQADANKIRGKLMGGTMVRTQLVSNPIDRDGSLDTTIVAHEWAHILTNRLIGNGSGLASLQGGGMGEGWSDFVPLLTIVRPEDVMLPGGAGWAGTYAVGSYATGSKAAVYEGIRRYPYSTDKNKNPLTFKHIANGTALPDVPAPSFGADGANNAEVHNTGEVWGAMLWECYTALLKDGRYTFEQANKKMREYLVAGLKLTPNYPTILEARDAILAAAYAGEPKDYDLFWQAFARRGAGTGAKGPDRTSRDNTPVTESFAVGNDLTFVSATLDDSVTSCDKDGILDPGETGLVKITIRNTGGGALTASKVTLSADSAAVSFPDGAAVTFPRIDPYKTGFVTVKVALKDRDVPPQLKFNLTMDFTDPNLTDPRPIQQKQSVAVNYDEVPESSATDTVDLKNTLWSVAGDMMLDDSIKWERRFDGDNGYWHIDDNEAPSDQYVISPKLVVGDMPFGVTFKHRHSFESSMGKNYDGGVIEVSTDNGATWTDVGDKITMGGYTGSIDSTSPTLPNKRAFTGSSAGYAMGTWVTSKLDFGTAYKGQTVQLRFRVGTDEGTGAPGWDVDELAFTGLKTLPFASRVDNKSMCTNRPPVANAGSDITVKGGDAVSLQGSGTDPDGDALTYRWTQSGGAMVSLSDVKSATPKFTAPEAMDMATELSFTLVVNDGKVDSAPSTVKVTVSPKDTTMMPPGEMPPGTDPMDMKGCACNVPGRGAGTTTGAGLGIFAALGMLLRLGRRRRRD